MIILAVDDEIIALEGLIKSIKEADSSAKVVGFRFSDEAIDFINPSKAIISSSTAKIFIHSPS